MITYLILLRGINVGGKNKIPMTELREYLEKSGFSNVSTYIASGNVILDSDKTAHQVQLQIESDLPERFKLNSELIKVLVMTRQQLQKIVDSKPKDFGDHPAIYHSDVVFLMGISPTEAMKVFDPREDVDSVWTGDLAIYSQRLSAERTKSRLSKIVGTTAYQSMTVRTWGTVTKLLEIMSASK